jgi:hypothetical protein
VAGISGAVTWQLTWVEVGRLFRNPYLWAAAAVTLGLHAWTSRHLLPNLSEASVSAATGAFLFGAALLMVANLATLRDQRHGMPETLGSLPQPAEVRTRGGIGRCCVTRRQRSRRHSRC